MADQPLRLRSDGDLEAALRALGETVEWPAAPMSADGADLAATVRARIEASRPSPAPGRSRWSWRPARRAIVLAVAILLALAALAAAVGLGLPGLRLVPGPAPVSPPPSLAPSRSPATGAPGATLGLGDLIPLDELDARAGFPVSWPADAALGPPDAAYVDDTLGGQVALVWRSRPGLPDTLEPGVGLILTGFRGRIDAGFYTKSLGSGTRVTAVKVDGVPGFWLSGDPHFLFYEGKDGSIQDPRRWVGDALIWAKGPITYRLETSLDQASAIRLAESMP